MLKLIYGPSGSGKTELITQAIRADVLAGRRCFLLVPEQQAYISERDLPSRLPENAGLYLEIVNFSRLAEDVFRQYGGVTQKSVGAAERTVLMWDTLRQLAPSLSQYGKNAATDLSLPSLMLSAVEDLRASGITVAALESAAKRLPSDLSLTKKLADLSAISAEFSSRCESCFGSDPSDKLLRMAELLRGNAYFADCNLYIDSFTSFTYPEYEVLRQILRQANTVTVSLLTNSPASSLPHFKGTVRTGRELEKLASDVNSDLERITLKPDPDQKPHALEILSRDLWHFDLKKEERETPREHDSVRLISSANLYEESEAIALNILELVQSGMHYGDIAVVARDVETYRGVLDAALERYGIPFFFSERTELASKPLSRLILSSLRAIGHHYRAQDMMTILKTGLLDVPLADAAMFEEYCETWHISGSRFCDPVWNMNPDGLTTERSARADVILDAANRVRAILVEPLERFSAALRASVRLTDRVRALYSYLSDLHISERLAERARLELGAGNRREAGETLRLYRFTVDTLSTLCTLLPKAEVSIDELTLVLTLLFAESDLGSVPSVHDCVIVGSASTLRVENVKASLLVGLCEGEFPAAVSDDGILSDAEKMRLEEFEINFNTNTRLRSAEELLYVYRAMTKPTERLILSTVKKQTDGSARIPSLAFTRVKYLLDAKVEDFDSSFVNQALEVPPFMSDPAALRLPLMPSGTVLRLSQSSIRSFAGCPYSYYSRYGLALREQKDSRPSYADDGTFLHYIFEHLLRRSIDENGKFCPPAEEELEPLSHELADEYINLICPIEPARADKRLLHIFSRLHRLSLIILRDVLDELKYTCFTPARFEVNIGKRENSLPPVVFELKNNSKVSLSGKIDRVDFWERADGGVYVRVIDYKTGTHDFKIEDVRSGADIQPVLYLAAMIAADPTRYLPGGAQYLYHTKEDGNHQIVRSGFYAEDEPLKPVIDTSPNRSYVQKLAAQTPDQIKELTADMKTAVTSIAERILEGEAQKTPSKEACRFCPIRQSCDRVYRE